MMGYRYQLERIRINAEIYFESFVDYLNDRGIPFRKAMIGVFVVAVVMTLKSSRQSVKKVKDIGFAHSVQYKPAMSGSSAAGGYHHTPPLGGYSSTLRTPPLGGSSAAGLRGTAPLGETSSGGYNAYSSGAGGYGNMARTTLTTFSTAELLDSHGDTVRVVPGDFRDFGGSTDFFGQVDTLQTFEGCGVVEKVLQSPGNGKVLIVDGGGNLNSAVLDENGVKQAQRNGWKGIVVVGAIRGSKSISSLQIGVKALGASPRKGRATTGNKGVNLSFSGIQVVPGNWIYCDKDGIVLSDHALSASSSSINGAVSMDSSVSSGYGETEGIPGIYGNPAIGASGAGRINPVSTYGSASTGTGNLGASPLSTGLGGTQSSMYANRVAPARTTTSGLPSAAGSTASSFSSYSHRRNYSSPGGGSKNRTMGYIIVAVCLFWIVIVLRYVGRD